MKNKKCAVCKSKFIPKNNSVDNRLLCKFCQKQLTFSNKGIVIKGIKGENNEKIFW